MKISNSFNDTNQFKFKSIRDLFKTFNSNQKCIEFLEKELWDNQLPPSPFDPTSKVYKCKNNRYRCRNTGKYFNVLHGTIMEGTKLSLDLWFAAIWLFTTHKGGLSSMQLMRDLNITQKTSWYMLQKIKDNCWFENNHILEGEVEIDETYVGGKNGNRHYDKKVPKAQGRNYFDKAPVLGMIQRDGKVVAHVVNRVSKEVLEPIILRTISAFSTVYTDEWKAYNDLHFTYDHHIVNHGMKQYVNGNATTNTIENFWGNLKRGIIGIYRVVSRKHLQRYVNEFVFKRNTMDMLPVDKFKHFIKNMFGFKITQREIKGK